MSNVAHEGLSQQGARTADAEALRAEFEAWLDEPIQNPVFPTMHKRREMFSDSQRIVLWTGFQACAALSRDALPPGQHPGVGRDGLQHSASDARSSPTPVPLTGEKT